MEGEVEHGEVGDDHVLALRLEVHLEREGPDVGEHDGDVPEGDGAGDGGDLGVLAQGDEHGLSEEVDGEQDDGADEEDDPGALEVDAEHVVLLGAVGLAAQRLQGARHAQLQFTVANVHQMHS